MCLTLQPSFRTKQKALARAGDGTGKIQQLGLGPQGFGPMHDSLSLVCPLFVFVCCKSIVELSSAEMITTMATVLTKSHIDA